MDATPLQPHASSGLLPWWLILAIGWLNVAAGAFIYVLGRTKSLVVFRWLDTLGLSTTVDTARTAAATEIANIPGVILYSYPDGAWVFGFMCHMAWVWRHRPGREATIWTMLGPALGLGGELGQLPGWVPGTFDANDLFAVGAATLSGYFLTKSRTP